MMVTTDETGRGGGGTKGGGGAVINVVVVSFVVLNGRTPKSGIREVLICFVCGYNGLCARRGKPVTRHDDAGAFLGQSAVFSLRRLLIQQRPLAFFHCSSGSADLTEHQRWMFPYLHPCSYVRRMSLLVPDRPGRAWGFPVVIPSSVTNPCCNLQKPQGAAPPVCGTRNAAAACSLMGPNHDRAQATTPCLPPSNRRRRTSERTTKRRQRRPFPSQGGKSLRGGERSPPQLAACNTSGFLFVRGGGGFLANSADAYYNGMRRCCFSPGPSCGKPRQGKASCRR